MDILKHEIIDNNIKQELIKHFNLTKDFQIVNARSGDLFCDNTKSVSSSEFTLCYNKDTFIITNTITYIPISYTECKIIGNEIFYKAIKEIKRWERYSKKLHSERRIKKYIILHQLLKPTKYVLNTLRDCNISIIRIDNMGNIIFESGGAYDATK
jgi:hypothetical protein